jgi:hypothetical protein
LRAFATRFSVCLSPGGNGSIVPECPMSFAFSAWTFALDAGAPQLPQLASSAPPLAGSSAATSSSLR